MQTKNMFDINFESLLPIKNLKNFHDGLKRLIVLLRSELEKVLTTPIMSRKMLIPIITSLLVAVNLLVLQCT